MTILPRHPTCPPNTHTPAPQTTHHTTTTMLQQTSDRHCATPNHHHSPSLHHCHHTTTKDTHLGLFSVAEHLGCQLAVVNCSSSSSSQHQSQKQRHRKKATKVEGITAAKAGSDNCCCRKTADQEYINC